MLPWFELVSRHYFRVERDGLGHLGRAPALIVGNHNGGIAGPDLVCTLATLWRTLGPDAPLYALAHDFAMRHVPALGKLLGRIGAIRACPENAGRVLAAGGQCLVYPGGDLDAYRSFRRRNQVVLGTRTGFVHAARAAGVPIVPVVAQGAHRSAVIFTEGRWLARKLRLPSWGRLERFPMAFALPWGVAIGPWLPYLPLPFRIRLRVLPAIDAGGTVALAVVAEEVRRCMQAAMDEMAARS
jgi:1-acyl-sn-glycerol-3-phosphate acyltransferase